MLKIQSGLAKKYPRREPWDYIATAFEDIELKKLRDLRAAIQQSKDEFKRGQEERLDVSFFKVLKEVNNHTVFISPSAKTTLTMHIQKLRQEPEYASHQDANWLIEQLQNFFLNKLPANPARNPRLDMGSICIKVRDAT